jgi:hypothetical protein
MGMGGHYNDCLAIDIGVGPKSLLQMELTLLAGIKIARGQLPVASAHGMNLCDQYEGKSPQITYSKKRPGRWYQSTG